MVASGPSYNQKRGTTSRGALGIWRQHISPIWVCYSSPLTKWSKNVLLLSGVQNKRRLCKRSRPLCKLPCHLGHMNRQIQWCLKCQRQIGCCLGPLGGPYRWISVQVLRILEKIPAILCRQLLSFGETDLGLLLGLHRDSMLNHGPPSYQATWAAHCGLGVIWPIKPSNWACTAALHHQMEVVYMWWGRAGPDTVERPFEDSVTAPAR